jgi:hypothetical protein
MAGEDAQDPHGAGGPEHGRERGAQVAPIGAG